MKYSLYKKTGPCLLELYVFLSIFGGELVICFQLLEKMVILVYVLVTFHNFGNFSLSCLFGPPYYFLLTVLILTRYEISQNKIERTKMVTQIVWGLKMAKNKKKDQNCEKLIYQGHIICFELLHILVISSL